ncbi:MAG: BamA/TamA family outer membrane protein, partial [Candidatus Paceibacterales bacterium]
VGSSSKSSYYFDGLIDLSGNIIGLAQGADYKNNPKEIFGVTFAQYIKIQPDFRYYFHLSNSAIIASRILVGVGFPYGNSSQLPNIKQFWAGGNSDLRGFPSRLVGPGTFSEYNDPAFKTNSFVQTLGDLKMEINTELRQNIYKFINLGVFAEAGNIWLYRKNPSLPGGEFTADFYKQLAADVGFGLRFDFKILLLRLDFGFPVLKPWLSSANSRALNSNTLKDMVLNLAIGYPF